MEIWVFTEAEFYFRHVGFDMMVRKNYNYQGGNIFKRRLRHGRLAMS